VIYEHGEPWLNDVHRGKLLIRLPELSGNPASSRLVANQEKMSEINDKFGFTKYYFSSKGFLTCRKILSQWADSLTSTPKEHVLRIFIALRKSVQNVGSNGKHANRYTTEKEFIASFFKISLNVCF
jgi:hypothetical protein